VREESIMWRRSTFVRDAVSPTEHFAGFS